MMARLIRGGDQQRGSSREMVERYGDFELLRLIATGGMAEIHLAKRGGLGGFSRTVVVKRMLPQLAVRSDFVQMFLDEARLAANLNHPNIVQVFNLGEVDNSYFIAMEFVDGPHLGTLFAHSLRLRKPLPVEQCAYIVARAADGLHYAHEQDDPASGQALQIVHRDISPQNILVSRLGDIKVTDFGVAKASTQQTKTRTGIIKGKVSYMSPEQCLGEIVDRRTDVFALGIVLYELLTRRRLFRDKSDLLVMQKITGEDVPPPSSINRDLDPEIDAICARALARNRRARFQTAAELAEALDSWLVSRVSGDSRMQLQRWFEQNAAELSLGQEIEMGSSPSTSKVRPSPQAGETTSATPSLKSAESAVLTAAPESAAAPATIPSSAAAAATSPSPRAPGGAPASTALFDGGPADDEETQRAANNATTASNSSDPLLDLSTVPSSAPKSTVPSAAIPSSSAAPSASAQTSLAAASSISLASLEPFDSSRIGSPSPPSSRRKPILIAAAACLALVVAFIAYRGTDAPAPDEQVIAPEDDTKSALLAAMAGPRAAADKAPLDEGLDKRAGEPPPSNKAAAQNSAELVIESVPSGVAVLLDDDRIIGKTPITIAHAPGKVRLQAQFMPPIVEELEVKAGDKRTVRLLAKTALIVKTSPKRAKVRINGELFGETPIERAGFLRPEKPVRVKLELAGWDFGGERVLTPEAGKPLVIDVTGRRQQAASPPPAPKFGLMNMRSAPWVNVRVGREKLGATTFLNAKVPAGRQTLVLTNAEEGINETLALVIPEDKTVNVNLEWEKSDGGWRLKSKVIK